MDSLEYEFAERILNSGKHKSNEGSVKNYRNKALHIAKDFHYDISIICRIQSATTITEINNALGEGRRALK